MGNVFARSPRPVVRPTFVDQPKSRADLLPWASQYNYPALTFAGIKLVKLEVWGLPPVTQPLWYSIGLDGCKENKFFWETAIQLGTDDMVDGLLVHIKSLSKEQLESMRRVKRG